VRAKTFTAGPGLPALGGEASAYRWVNEDAERAKAEDLAGIFGIEGEVIRAGAGLQVEGEELTLSVDRLSWAVFPTSRAAPTPGSAPGVFDDGLLPEPLDPSQDTPIPGLPGEDEARRIALDTLEAAGVDIDGADVTVEPGTTQVSVDVELRVDGLRVLNQATNVRVGPGGRIEEASGTIVDFEDLGAYPLVETDAAAERLNHGWEGGVPLEDPALTGRGIDVLATGAELVLVSAIGWDGSLYLVPAYHFVTEDGVEHAPGEATVVAVAEDLIDPGLDPDAGFDGPTVPDHPDAEVTIPTQVAAPLSDCGIDDVWTDDQRWRALDPPFNATNAPSDYAGEGELEAMTGLYTDESGITIQFSPVDWDHDPPPCD
jgi:hypothetical protein